jgi:predicted Rdx family selenoprotein
VLEGGRGQFDVVASDALVFSKQREGRFPDEGELAGLLDAPA